MKPTGPIAGELAADEAQKQPGTDVRRSTSITKDIAGDTVIVQEDGENFTISAAAEQNLLWKFDLHILPLLTMMYLFNSLDKANLGNAKTAGLEKDLGFAGTNKYNILLSIFFVPYVLTAPFLGMLGKIYGPSRVLPCMMFSFGTMTLLVISVYNWSGLMALRWFLGMAESAFFPLVIYYQTQFYRRGELARRLAIFYAASNIAGAFGGLLAYGVFQAPDGVLPSWKYLFAVEGSLTIVGSIIAFIFLPYNASQASFLTPEEKKLAFYRIQVDSSAEVESKFNLREGLKILRHPTSWVILAIEICLGIPLQSVTLFLPQIVARLGYSTIKTNLYTVAPNCTGAVMLLILAYASDHTRWRFPFIALGFFFTFVGFVIYGSLDVESHIHVAYFACFMMTWGTSAPSVILDVWYNNNIADENRRLLLTSIAVPVANLMGVVSSNIFRNQDAPNYLPALATTAAFGGMGIVLTLALGAWMVMDNRRRDRKQGFKVRAKDVATERLKDGPHCEDFRWFY
ncbi:Putative major facilitator superfamily, MFS transporter superfamily [Septoria linicola]|uniref:Major facilitator superfamily, MFS transporter superfamily n=1 Tax=Septoria linicola TaxID=215465 RepID=A0A9Q9EQR8_9PEZI|nr:putative major facilitator superfamily, MFS transporter superfamily [Septoria linicola]USW59084.1 Putative major facilitator superfamily, MFS transporter superfamily [Septoria linicola]